ncbi:MAG TPA: hypothetical protein VMF06_12115 [Candidatus Limnocylindria bacterium]|nr:hypothetical protein [Candidatus Limnocylindria bacterium]
MRIAVLGVLITGCATSATDPRNIAKRQQERAAAFQALSAEDQALVSKGQIRVGLSPDAVYIAWGQPAQTLQSEDNTGRSETWLYEDSTTDEYIYWNYREVRRPDGSAYFDRFPDRTYNFRDFVSAELVFKDGKLARWRTLPRPASSTTIVPR